MARRFRHGLSVPSLSSDGASLVISCSVSTYRSSNRTCGFPASGSRTRVDHVPAYATFRGRCCNRYVGFASAFSCKVCWSFLTFSGGDRLTVNLLAFFPFRPSPELRSLSSPGITRVHRYYEPLRHPSMPDLSLTGVRLGFTHMRGFPCCLHYPLAYMPSPLPRLTGAALRSSHHTSGGLPCRNVRSAQQHRFSRPAQCLLPLGPIRSLIPQGNL